MGEAHYFPTPAAFRAWLKIHHASAREVQVGYRRKHTGETSIAWPESIVEALCFGWIDGVRQPIDPDSYTVRFTPRRANSNWSAVNIASAERLIAEGRMAPAGLAAFEARVEGKPRAYVPKDAMPQFAPEHVKALAADPTAQAFWNKLPPSHRHKLGWWVNMGKQASTRDARMAKLIAACAAGKRLM